MTNALPPTSPNATTPAPFAPRGGAPSSRTATLLGWSMAGLAVPPLAIFPHELGHYLVLLAYESEPLAKLRACGLARSRTLLVNTPLGPDRRLGRTGGTRRGGSRVSRRVLDRALGHRWVTDARRAPRGIAGGTGYVTRRTSWSAVSASTPNMQWHITFAAPRTRTWRPPNYVTAADIAPIWGVALSLAAGPLVSYALVAGCCYGCVRWRPYAVLVAVGYLCPLRLLVGVQHGVQVLLGGDPPSQLRRAQRCGAHRDSRPGPRGVRRCCRLHCGRVAGEVPATRSAHPRGDVDVGGGGPQRGAVLRLRRTPASRLLGDGRGHCHPANTASRPLTLARPAASGRNSAEHGFRKRLNLSHGTRGSSGKRTPYPPVGRGPTTRSAHPGRSYVGPWLLP